MKAGDNVYYDHPLLGTMSAVVRRVHRDESVSVEPFFLYRGGERQPGFWGGQMIRLHREDLRPQL